MCGPCLFDTPEDGNMPNLHCHSWGLIVHCLVGIYKQINLDPRLKDKRVKKKPSQFVFNTLGLLHKNAHAGFLWAILYGKLGGGHQGNQVKFFSVVKTERWQSSHWNTAVAMARQTGSPRQEYAHPICMFSVDVPPRPFMHFSLCSRIRIPCDAKSIVIFFLFLADRQGIKWNT